MRLKVLTGVIVGMLVLLGCGNSAMSSGSGGGPGSGAPTFDATGKWQITTQSQSGTTGGATATIQQNNGSITGSLTNIEPPCAATASFTGNVSLNKISFTVDESGQSVSFTGATTGTGTLSGTYTAAAGGCTNGASGTWTAKPIPAVQ